MNYLKSFHLILITAHSLWIYKKATIWFGQLAGQLIEQKIGTCSTCLASFNVKCIIFTQHSLHITSLNCIERKIKCIYRISTVIDFMYGIRNSWRLINEFFIHKSIAIAMISNYSLRNWLFFQKIWNHVNSLVMRHKNWIRCHLIQINNAQESQIV